jgi:hypothetical protein
MFRFKVDSRESISECKVWLESILQQVENQHLEDYADNILGWMGSIAGILSLTTTERSLNDMQMLKRAACLVGSNPSVLTELKYRTIDMLCALDNDHCTRLQMKAELEGLSILADKLWSVLEIAARTTYRMLDQRKLESRTPPINPQF